MLQDLLNALTSGKMGYDGLVNDPDALVKYLRETDLDSKPKKNDLDAAWFLRNQVEVLIRSIDIYVFGDEVHHPVPGKYDETLDRQLAQEDGYFAGHYIPASHNVLTKARKQAKQTSDIIIDENVMYFDALKKHNVSFRPEYTRRYMYKLRRSLVAHRDKLDQCIGLLEQGITELARNLNPELHSEIGNILGVPVGNVLKTIIKSANITLTCVPISLRPLYDIVKDSIIREADYVSREVRR